MNKLLLTALLALCPYLAMGQSNQKTTGKTPLIGISCSHPGRSSSTQMTYTESIIQAGGTPILIPITTDSLVLTDIANRLDGIILIGGGDIHPSYFNESPIEQLGEVDSLRDVYDMTLIRLAAQRNIPMFGICRGEQLINVAFGGTLYQDIPTQHPDTTVCHQQQEPSSIPTHTVHLTPGSAMASITGQTQLFTNTHHHQAVKQVAPGFSVTGWSSDSIPEAILPTNIRYGVCNSIPKLWLRQATASLPDSSIFWFKRQLPTGMPKRFTVASSPSTRIQTPHLILTFPII